MTPQTNDQPEPGFGGRLIRFVIPAWHRRTNRRVLMYLPGGEPYRQDFKVQFERCLLGQ
jgi:hypothetical protein